MGGLDDVASKIRMRGPFRSASRELVAVVAREGAKLTRKTVPFKRFVAGSDGPGVLGVFLRFCTRTTIILLGTGGP
jgi:hypothetical protein